MKSLQHPRAVLVTRDEAAREAFRQALARVGIEGYGADSLESAVQRAEREDTILVVLAGHDDTTAILEALKAIRQEPKSADVLVAVFSTSPTEAFYEAGANVVDTAEPTSAAAYRMLIRLLKRPSPAFLATPERESGTDPLTVLMGLVEKRWAHHKIYLGAAPGVGKTFAMLSEAHERAKHGEDVVVGVVETHSRADTADRLEGLEVVPRRQIDYKGTSLEELDLEAVLARRPALALVDELAHTNVPGSLNAKRYEDVNVLLLAGIPVISTMNIQHLESLNNLVERLTGVKVRETVPDSVLEEADEVILVDISPEALQKRLQAGKIYARDKVTQSLSNFFTTHNLTALRELVLRELADKVDERLEEVRANIGKALETTGIQDRLLACITPTPHAERIVRRAARLADRLSGRLVVLHVENRPLTADEQKALSRNLALAESFDAEVVRLKHPEVGEAIARYAANHQVTILLLGETRKSRWSALVNKPIVDVLLERTHNIDVVIVATHV